MNTDNLAFNKKKTKVVITGNPKYFNMLGTFVQFGPILAFLSFKYDLFKSGDSLGQITGWGIIGLAFVFIMFRSKIKEKLAEYDNSLGETWKRSKSGTVALVLTLVLFGMYFVSYSLLFIFGIYGISTYASLLLYAPYDKLNVKKLKLQKLLDNENQTTEFESLKTKFLEEQTK